MKNTDYDRIAESWHAMRKELPPKDRELFNFFMASLSPGSHVLDLGCGTGLMARELCDQGFSVTGVDASEKLLAIARKAVPKATLLCHRIEEYVPGSDVDAVIVWDCLFHLPREIHPHILEKIYQSLPEGGSAILTSGGSEVDIPPFTDFMCDVEFFYDSLTVGALKALCGEIGFTIKRFVVLNEIGRASCRERV